MALQVNRDRGTRDLLDINQQHRPQFAQKHSSVGDSLFAGLLNSHWNGEGLRIYAGRIVQAIPHCHAYRVQLDDLGGTIPCCLLSQSALTPLGVRDGDLLPANTNVLVMRYRKLPYGFILGAIPRWLSDGSAAVPDWIQQGGNTGFHREAAHHAVLLYAQLAGGTQDFSNSRPIDATALGEFNRLSETGVGLHVDSFQTWIRVNEICGMFLNYLDHYMRLAGWNMDLQTAVHEWQVRQDQGENQFLEGFSVYPWETMGSGESAGQPFQTHSDDEVIYSKAVGAMEPKFDDQRAFHRCQRWQGYLGQGGLREVVIPRGSSAQLNRVSTPLDRLGLFREFIGLDGDYGLESAHSVSIRKYALIPAIHPKFAPEDNKQGDGAPGHDYRFSGDPSGKGDQHKIGDVEATSGKNKGQRTVAGLMDRHAHAFNWKALHPFHYHKQDFKLPQEGDDQTLKAAWDKLDFDSARGGELPDPEAKELQVDHRYKSVKYYLREVFLDMLKEGHLAMGDGSGCSITMVNGCMELSAPLDIRIRPGRSFIVMAGDDAIIRAKASVDITASEHDVHIKAEKNMQLLAGNSGTGGLLLESRANNVSFDANNKIGEDQITSGVVIRCPQSQFVSWSAGAYIRTGGGSTAQGFLSGPIVLDSDEGHSPIRTNSNVFERYLGTYAADYFGTSGKITAANQFNGATTLLGSGLQVKGQVNITEGGLLVDQNISAQGEIGSVASQPGIIKNKKSIQDIKNAIQQTVSNLAKITAEAKILYRQDFTQQIYADKKVGNSTVIDSVSFSLRDDGSGLQYNTAKLVLAESRWQQMVRLGMASGGKPWTEKSVDYRRQKLFPYPGRPQITGQGLLQMDLKLVDTSARHAKTRGSDYETPNLADGQLVGLNGHYLIVPGE